MLRHHYPEYEYTNDIFRTIPTFGAKIERDKLYGLLAVSVYDSIGDGVYEYRRQVSESGNSGFWMYRFYKRDLFIVHHFKNGEEDASAN